MSVYAYLTVKGNPIGAAPGLTVRDENRGAIADFLDLGVDLSKDTVYAGGEHYADIEKAEKILENYGFRVEGGWHRENSQWIAYVTRD